MQFYCTVEILLCYLFFEYLLEDFDFLPTVAMQIAKIGWFSGNFPG